MPPTTGHMHKSQLMKISEVRISPCQASFYLLSSPLFLLPFPLLTQAVVETAGNSPGPVIKKLKAAGVIILHKCTTIRHAQSAINLGVDFLSIDGFECAGHVGETDITNFI